MALNAHGSVCPLSSTSSSRRWKYHVFLSFRGEDTRRSFTDHLYHTLQHKGIIAFRDDEELERGHSIKRSLLQAIKESLSAIVVLSANYASSSWCLDELLHILESQRQKVLKVFPIFYGVNPSNFRHQTGNIGKAFEKHEEIYAQDKVKVQRWRDALKEVANLSGWHSDDNWHETKLIETVIEDMWSKIYDELPFDDSEILVGIESKVAVLNSFIANGMGEVQFIGIWGTGGLGKTTLARTFYERRHKNFKVHCFLHNVREVAERDGLISLQRKLLSSLHKKSYIDVIDCYDGRKMIKNLMCNRKVLLILDDVSEISQLENLAGKQGWFGEGSVIIMTSRDKHVFSSYDVSTQYDMKLLSDDESHELFHQNAFKGKKPKKDYLELARTVIQYANGLPLVLKVLGSFLYGKSLSEWEDAIAKFKKLLPNEIFKILQVSFDGLDDDEKTIFLDIAFFFNGMQKDYVIRMLKNMDLHPIVGIKVLIDKSLVIDDNGILRVHDILQDMGKNIVIQESPNDVRKRTRIWSLEDANSVLEGHKGSESIRGIVLRIDEECVSYWNPKAFSMMSNLKLLIITSRLGESHCSLNLPYGLDCFPSTLQILQWNGFCLDDMPTLASYEESVDLKMKQHSPSKQLFQGSQIFETLVDLDLSYSRNLIRTSNFNEIPNLQNLILKGCINLIEVHPSLGHHQNLFMVNLKGCKSIKTLPSKFEMKCLKTLVLSGCLQVRRLPEFGESMRCLSTLDVEDTGIKNLPESIVNLSQLVDLNMRNCKNLVCLPNVFHYLKALRNLNISGCPKLSRLPEHLNENIEELDASRTAINEVPPSILHLNNLRSLSFGGCGRQAESSSPNLASFWTRFFRLIRPSVSTGLLLPPSLSDLKNLRDLDLSYCNLFDESFPNDINSLSSLRGLNLSGNNFVNLHVGLFSNLLSLHKVRFNHCTRLQSLPLPPPNLHGMHALGCPSMKDISCIIVEQLWKIFEQLQYQGRHVLLSNRIYHFFMAIGGRDVPSWFHNQSNFFSDDAWEMFKPNMSFITNIHDHHYSSKRLGVAVCLYIECPCSESSNDHEDGIASDFLHCICRNFGDEIPNVTRPLATFDAPNENLLVFFFRCTNNKRLQISFHMSKNRVKENFEIKKCGWREICAEDIEEWRRTRGEGCSTSNIDSDIYHSLNEMGATEETSASSSHSQFINVNEEEGEGGGGQSNSVVDIQMPLTKRRKL